MKEVGLQATVHVEFSQFVNEVTPALVAADGCLLVLKGQLELVDDAQLNGIPKMRKKKRPPAIPEDPNSSASKKNRERKEKLRRQAEKNGVEYIDSDEEEEEVMILYDTQDLVCK